MEVIVAVRLEGVFLGSFVLFAVGAWALDNAVCFPSRIAVARLSSSSPARAVSHSFSCPLAHFGKKIKNRSLT